MRLTHIGGPTALIEIGDLRLLTDPTFDPAGKRYRFGWGTASNKVAGPALAPGDLGRIDAVLLSHDHHGDNLDPAGRALLPSAGVVVTTTSGARRLGGSARGLEPWETTALDGIEITATPCRHGPPGFGPIVGDVIGFVLRWDDRVVWISGDTVLYDGVRSVAGRWDIDVAIMHLGGVQFPVTGPLRYTMTASDAVELSSSSSRAQWSRSTTRAGRTSSRAARPSSASGRRRRSRSGAPSAGCRSASRWSSLGRMARMHPCSGTPTS